MKNVEGLEMKTQMYVAYGKIKIAVPQAKGEPERLTEIYKIYFFTYVILCVLVCVSDCAASVDHTRDLGIPP